MLPEISHGSFEASKSILAMRRAASDSHPFLSRSVGPDDEEEPKTPRAGDAQTAAAAGDGSPQMAASPFLAAAVSGLGVDDSSSTDPRVAQPASTAAAQGAATGVDATGVDTAAAWEEEQTLAGTEDAEAAQAEQLASAEQDKATAADAGVKGAAEVKPKHPALAVRQSSGAEASCVRSGSLDLGMLPPREMQVQPVLFPSHMQMYCFAVEQATAVICAVSRSAHCRLHVRWMVEADLDTLQLSKCLGVTARWMLHQI